MTNRSSVVRTHARRGAVIWHVCLLILSILLLVPLAAMFVGSLRLPGLPPPRGIEWLPNPLSWSNYIAVFHLVELGRYGLNTMVVEVIAVPVTLITASWAGFALAQMSTRLARQIIGGALLTLLLPEMALWVSRFIVYKFTNILDTPWALIAPALLGTTPLYMLIFYWTFRRVPRELWEAAQLDGVGALRAWWAIGIPVGRAAFAAVGVLTFVYYWREFNEPLLYLQSLQKYTLSVGLAYLEQLDPTNWPLLLAGSVIITAPVLVVFLIAQPFFLEPPGGSAIVLHDDEEAP
jgi:multiple sugar transport system permease protein